jgi:cytochrome c oxidase assembly factor 4
MRVPIVTIPLMESQPTLLQNKCVRISPKILNTFCFMDDDEDEYVKRIKRTGCYDQHVKLLECHFDSKDFRKCTKEMQEFRICFQKHTAEAGQQNSL